ncbi:MAG: TatD family hydrolase [Lachnospiraceae bacterium]|nr:TatD family hydrolase [Lachnospiraceae bacterium]
MIYETHTHFDDKAFDEDRSEAIKRAMAAGVARFVNVGASMDSSRTSVELAHLYPEFYASVGVHPEEAATLTDNDMKTLAKYSEDENVVAIGEIGLDYYWDEPERNIQKDVFAKQIALARTVNLPLIVHSRDAAADTIDILKSEKAEEAGGILHCFSYSVETARQCMDMGFYIGVGGVVTFKNGRKLKEVVEFAPLDRIVTETDSPYMAPVPFRGKRNSSEFLPYVIKEIAEIKGLSCEEVEQITFDNAVRLFGK